MIPRTGSELFAMARGKQIRRGDHHCFYCGAACDETHPASEYVKKTCTIRQYVCRPDSNYVCVGCAASKQEKTTVPVYGEEEPRENTRIRLYSWVITRDKAQAATKAHAAYLQETCVNPPDPPFAIALSTSGQRHVVYWTVVNILRDHVTVNLEMNRISYRPTELRERIDLTESLIAASGKTFLEVQPSPRLGMKVMERYGSLDRFNAWMNVWGQPLSRLAVFLSRKKKECKDDWESIEAGRGADTRSVPKTVSGPLFD